MKALPWLAAPARSLRTLGERLPHALLIEGPKGWGQERLAGGFALELLGLPAGREAREVAHPDLRWIEPDSGSIRIDVVRRTIEFLVQTPQVAGRKIAVVQDAERCNPSAANALLKTLEEPPPESFIVLASGAAERLLPTVRSRCQRIAIRALDDAALFAWLTDQGAPAEACGYLAVEYGGAPLAVLAAVERQQPPLWAALTAGGGATAQRLIDDHRDDELAELIARWLRVVCWLSRRTPRPSLPPLLRFAETLAVARRIALLNTGLNRAIQVQRLADLWELARPHLANTEPPCLVAAQR